MASTSTSNFFFFAPPKPVDVYFSQVQQHMQWVQVVQHARQHTRATGCSARLKRGDRAAAVEAPLCVKGHCHHKLEVHGKAAHVLALAMHFCLMAAVALDSLAVDPFAARATVTLSWKSMARAGILARQRIFLPLPWISNSWQQSPLQFWLLIPCIKGNSHHE